MTQQSIEHSRQRRQFADLAWMTATVAIVLSVAIAFTAVSIGIAHADTLGGLAASRGGRVAVALMVGAVIAVMGGLTAALVRPGARSAHD